MSESARPRGTLYLIPVSLGNSANSVLPPATIETARRLDLFIAENAKSARAFLKEVGHLRALREIEIHVLDEHSRDADVASLGAMLAAGRSAGLVSEAGCPAVADPGAALVREAHAAGVRVVPLPGPSSILLALMASGLNGQRFAFRGYLPVEAAARAGRIRELEARASDATQIFIETPYRNDALLDALLATCKGDTLLCVAADLTLATELVMTQTISEWKKRRPGLDRRPAVFLLGRGKS